MRRRRGAGDRHRDAGVRVERKVGTMLLERSERHEHDPPRGALNHGPGRVREICHRVLNYRGRPPRGEENRMSITPEQVEETTVEREPGEAAGWGNTTAPVQTAPPSDEELVVEDFLVEDVSIDGMCGVY
jgi:mycofactocin precursor